MQPDVDIAWRDQVTDEELNVVHAAAFDVEPRPFEWEGPLERWSLGWATARIDGLLVGFTNVLTDGGSHAWLQDVVVHPDHQSRGIGRALVDEACSRAGQAGCEWVHVDFDDEVAAFYLDALGFRPTKAGLRWVRPD